MNTPTPVSITKEQRARQQDDGSEWNNKVVSRKDRERGRSSTKQSDPEKKNSLILQTIM